MYVAWGEQEGELRSDGASEIWLYVCVCIYVYACIVCVCVCVYYVCITCVRVRNLDSGRRRRLDARDRGWNVARSLTFARPGLSYYPPRLPFLSCEAAEDQTRLEPRQPLGLHSRGVLVGYEEVLVLAGRVRRHGAKAEVVQPLDERRLVLLLAGPVHVAVRRRGPDRAQIPCALRIPVASRRVARSVHAATVELVAGDRGRVEVGRWEVDACVEVGG